AFGMREDGRSLLATGGRDRRVRIWDPDTGSALATLRRRTPVNTVALHGTTLAIGDQEGFAVVESHYTT
ncbi:hypothetical protein, partial [Arthrobacter mobilis]|uniref:hypothetical protein n=1 Tax=Arthrobacter mobilis TaxID=2724944 RepID=UPI00197BFF92